MFHVFFQRSGEIWGCVDGPQCEQRVLRLNAGELCQMKRLYIYSLIVPPRSWAVINLRGVGLLSRRNSILRPGFELYPWHDGILGCGGCLRMNWSPYPAGAIYIPERATVRVGAKCCCGTWCSSGYVSLGLLEERYPLKSIVNKSHFVYTKCLIYLLSFSPSSLLLLLFLFFSFWCRITG
ncbi:hypothetical protein GQ43DRAFT_8022 [Delitschia confertaspora ATCC 74209]|uniref:Uncharacterized protein n=1 Tax=Delitschia confertaspora ATCC 74209 TaxID=1513339 RepID=A0A9P4JT97_9PLEO|nr:hypothetical protein GQ43DRAFT_8022 [Delitschia confertaspora ATCC 74209]